MARQTNKLSARTVATTTKPGRYSDGGGLYLNVTATGRKNWVFRFTQAGRMTDMGLGSAAEITLARAREKAAAARLTLAEGVNPIVARKQSVAEAKPTFGAFADDLLSEILPGFKNAKHQAQWRHAIETHAAKLSKIPIDAVTTDDLLGVLRPLWQAKPETASRVRGRVERVLDAAKAKGLRSGENPARWRGHLEQLLPKRKRLIRGHHKAMPYENVPAFMAELASRSSTAGRALELTILTACRTNEALGARFGEIDQKQALWTIPKERMKTGREHRVPLSAAALAIVEAMRIGRDPKPGDLLFEGQRPGKPLSQMAMSMLLRRMKLDATTHGFRSAFRDWCGEETPYAREIAEAALAHAVGDATERAYRRGDALEKRRIVMDAWAAYCGGTK